MWEQFITLEKHNLQVNCLRPRFLPGILLLKKRYSVSKYLAVVCITAGVCLATLASTGPKAPTTPQASSNASSDQVGEAAAAAAVPLFERLIGIGMLTFALFVSALMGRKLSSLSLSLALARSRALSLALFLALSRSRIYQELVRQTFSQFSSSL